MKNIKIQKKSKKIEEYNYDKIRKAINIASSRIRVSLDETEHTVLRKLVEKQLKNHNGIIDVSTIHDIVEVALKEVSYAIYKQYADYRDYKRRFGKSFNDILQNANNVIYAGDKENANKDSCIISTKKEIVAGLVGKEFYLNYELPKHLADAHNRLALYIHDAGDRFFNSINCCLFDVGNVLKGGFNLNGKYIKQPKSIEKALDLLADIILVASSQQYGGFTIATIDEVFAPYVELSYKRLTEGGLSDEVATDILKNKIYKKIKSIQYKIECVNNANGQIGCL